LCRNFGDIVNELGYRRVLCEFDVRVGILGVCRVGWIRGAIGARVHGIETFPHTLLRLVRLDAALEPVEKPGVLVEEGAPYS
jgi:hypothetical protein